MSICEHLIDDPSISVSQKSPEEKLNIQNELIWGLTYRNYKENEKNKPIRPIHSPIDIPFEICRAEMRLKRKKETKPNFSAQVETTHEEKGGRGESPTKPSPSKFKTKKRTLEKPSLLDRSVWSQSKYMDFLSIPNPKFEEPQSKKYKKRCELEPCPPRFVQLAVPNKRKVFANWKEFAHFLPAEILMRFEEILHTDQNLEPREARYYYKKLDRQRRRELKKKKRMEKMKERALEKDNNWRKIQIESLAKDIVDYIADEPLFTLNYKQMLLSDGILERLEKTKIMKKPSRKTKNHYNKTVIEVADKFAIWIDTLTRFVDVQAVESDEDIPPLSISSLSAEESEGSSEYEGSSEDEIRDDQLFGTEEAIWGEEGGDYDRGSIGQIAEDIMKDLFTMGEGEGAHELEDMLNDLDGDILAKLIKILSNCSDDFLSSEIDSDKMPGVKYIDVLNKLKELQEGLAAEVGEKPFLEQVMIEWALRNDPDKVNDAVLQKIHEVAGLLGDWLYSGKHVVPGDSEGDIREQKFTQAEDLAAGGEDLIGQGLGGTQMGVGIEYGEGADISGADISGADIGGADISGADISGADISGADISGADMSGADIGGADISGADVSGLLSEDFEGGVGKGDIKSSHDTFLDDFQTTDGVGSTMTDLDGEEGIGLTSEIGTGIGEELLVGEEVSVLYEQDDLLKISEAEGLEGQIIKGHKPSKIFEHSPDTVCCLSLKTWAVWLLEITHNAHNWTQWMSCLIQKVREYASIVRGDVKLPNGETKVLRKAEWREFIKETEENVVAWRQYSAHVKDLSQSIVDNFHGKEVNCCPKCLQDHLIKNVVVAHDTLQALTEAISCAAYWQRCLDTLVEKTCGLTNTEKDEGELEVSSEESDGDAELEEVEQEDTGESIYEIEGIESNANNEAPNKQ